MAKELPRVTLKKPLTRHLQNGHPWLWADAIDVPRGTATGTVVDVVERDGTFIARGLYDARSPIALRVATLDPDETVDRKFIARRIAEALRARRGVIDPKEVTGFRWMNGEGDRLPGVVVDVYGPGVGASVAVLRLDGDAVRSWRDDVVAALVEQGRGIGVTHVYERARGAQGTELHGGPPPSPIEIREHGARFAVDVVHGQKTGFFLDQRENRRAIRRISRGLTVANLFAYTGGFSVQAALGGARHVTSVDIAKEAVAAARANFTLNGIDPEQHAFAAVDVFDFLEQARSEKRKFDLVIVDPPSFAPSERTKDAALKAYRKLNALALDVVAEDGLLASASCSSHIALDPFLDMLRDAAVDAGRPLRVLEVHGQPADHPTSPAFREGRYLKFVLLRASR
ncbi:MAG: class I SAM-dependent rRNA methyltransferase [Deltaproteobacteria bacterium]|nr:class I SAM-dependent rRNA methyltransferase [Deltaproteobacteria bacterium]